MLWAMWTLLAAIISTISKVLIKTILKKRDISQIYVFIFIGSAISAIILACLLKPKDITNYTNKTIATALTSGLLIPPITYSLYQSISMVSNLAYTGVTYAVATTILLLLSSMFIFNVKVNNMTILGITTALSGVIIILINK